MGEGTQAPAPVAENEPLTRFLVHRDWFGTNPPRVKHQAFMPHPYVELSVTRSQHFLDADLWAIGGEVARQQSKNLHGRGDVGNAAVLAAGLVTNPDEPPIGHAIIVGWPTLTGEKKIDKDQQKIYALQISGQAKLVLRSP